MRRPCSLFEKGRRRRRITDNAAETEAIRARLTGGPTEVPHGDWRGAPGVRCTCVRKVPRKPWGDSPALANDGGLGGRRVTNIGKLNLGFQRPEPSPPVRTSGPYTERRTSTLKKKTTHRTTSHHIIPHHTTPHHMVWSVVRPRGRESHTRSVANAKHHTPHHTLNTPWTHPGHTLNTPELDTTTLVCVTIAHVA